MFGINKIIPVNSNYQFMKFRKKMKPNWTKQNSGKVNTGNEKKIISKIPRNLIDVDLKVL